MSLHRRHPESGGGGSLRHPYHRAGGGHCERKLQPVRRILVVNPRSDGTFREVAEQLAANDADTPAALQHKLRERYPAAVVRERSLSNEHIVTWYVYREGTWVPT